MLAALLPLIGIMSAMPQEADSILNHMTDKKEVYVGQHLFTEGKFEGLPVVFSPSGIGKVSAATTASLLIAKFHVGQILFTGVAGGGHGVQIGDIVVGNSYLQHDIDHGTLFPPFYIYSLDTQLLEADRDLIDTMMLAANRFLAKDISFPSLGIYSPKAVEGAIISGDQFVGNAEVHAAITEITDQILPGSFQAVEMEGAAVAQVCTELEVPFVVLRAISDKADDQADVNFPEFLEQVATQYSLGILKEYAHLIKQEHSSNKNLDE